MCWRMGHFFAWRMGHFSVCHVRQDFVLAYGPFFLPGVWAIFLPENQVLIFITYNIVFCYTFVQVCNYSLLIIQIVSPYLFSPSQTISILMMNVFRFYFLPSWSVSKRYHQLPIRSIGFNIVKFYRSL